MEKCVPPPQQLPCPLATVLSLSTTLSYLSSRPGFPATLRRTRLRVRLSLKERRMKFINATNLNRKSGGAYTDFLLHGSHRCRLCGSPQREPHAVVRSRNSRQEIRGSGGICSAPLG